VRVIRWPHGLVCPHCGVIDAKREFLTGHIERVIYNRYNVAIVGTVPPQSASGETKLQILDRGRD
jgi:hypothetical protein